MQGTQAMTAGMSWALHRYLQAPGQLRFAPMPVVGTNQCTVIYTDGAAIMQSSENKQATWRVFEWLFRPENAGIYFGDNIVPRKGMVEIWLEHQKQQYGSEEINLINPQVYFEAGPYGVRSRLFTNPRFAPLWTNLRSWGGENILFGSNFQKVMNGEMAVGNFLSQAQEVLSNMLKQSEPAALAGR